MRLWPGAPSRCMPCAASRRTAMEFQPVAALHLLQMLIGAVDTPRELSLQAALPEACSRRGPDASRTKRHAPEAPLSTACPSASPTGPDDLLLEDDGTPIGASTRRFTWENPMSAHGAMHRVIANAAAGDPYPIDTLFLFMANMAWNSSMDVQGTLDALTATRSRYGRLPHSSHHLQRRLRV